jgi:hypothetical protein
MHDEVSGSLCNVLYLNSKLLMQKCSLPKNKAKFLLTEVVAGYITHSYHIYQSGDDRHAEPVQPAGQRLDSYAQTDVLVDAGAGDVRRFSLAQRILLPTNINAPAACVSGVIWQTP